MAHARPSGTAADRGSGAAAGRHDRVDEPHELDFGDRLHALGCHSDRQAGDHGFRQRRIHYAIRAEFLLQARRGPEHAAIDADIFPEHYDRVIAAHLVGKSHGQRFYQGDLGHQ
jgi:hypothetical protein